MARHQYGYLKKIISGGQTGVDRAALDAAIICDLEHGGWCPKNRKAEDGPISHRYSLTETGDAEYAARTELNIRHADGTLILVRGDMLEGGTLLTKKLAMKYCKPLMIIDLDKDYDYQSIWKWIRKNKISCLNIGGPRESKNPGIYITTRQFVIKWLRCGQGTVRV